ncbi:hypothetical protein [uncultured Nostoc sp.]|uniref:hypothetical protein n=1 Tax=uncultured Nostoc sp. TaxID=340711 RepID=UPI0035CC7279
MSNRSTKYQKQATLGLIGIVCIASPLFAKLPAQFQAFNTAAEIENSEKIERTRIEQRKVTAEQLAQAGVIPNGQKLKIRRYVDNPRRNPQPDTTGWLESEIIFVYDSAGTCIGRIEKRKWLWKHHYRNVCNNAPAM